MSQPFDRECALPQLAKLDSDAGEFWVENPFQLPASGENLSAFERNRLFLNTGGLEFIDASFVSGVDLDSDSRAVIAADFNGDAWPDILVGSAGGGSLRLFENRFERKHGHIRLKLTGVKSNRPGIGSRIEARIGDRTVVRSLFPKNGFSGQSPSQWLIGMGTAERVSRLAIRWPSGLKQTFKNLAANTQIALREGNPAPEISPLK